MNRTSPLSDTFTLVATDLDGTLLRNAPPASPRTLEAIRRVQEAGARVVPVTARGAWSTVPIAEEFGIRGFAVCASGAVIYDLDAGKIAEERLLDHHIARDLVARLRAEVPGVAFACSRSDGYAHEEGYVPSLPPPPGTPRCDALEFLDRPVQKLLVKHPERDAAGLLAAVRPHVDGGATAGSAGDTFVEILPAGATKGEALARLCARLGVGAREVIAFGDWPIDIGMLRWAAHGVAPASAHPEVLATADEITASNEEDGVAQVLERLLDDGRIARA